MQAQTSSGVVFSVTAYGVDKIYDRRIVEQYESARKFAAEVLAGLRGRSQATVDDRVDAESLIDTAIRREHGAHLDVRLGEGVKVTVGEGGNS